MATAKYEYNEVSHSCVPVGSDDVNGLDPMYHYDTHFPERMSRLHISPEYASPSARRSKGRTRNRNNARFKTQPITFDEIKEVDEEASPGVAIDLFDRTKQGLKHQFAAFSRSMDGIIPCMNTDRMERQAPTPAETLAAQAKAAVIPTPETKGKEQEQRTSFDQESAQAPSEKEAVEMKLPEGLPMESNAQRNRRRLKKKKHNRSIEEAPELLKSEELQNVR